MQNEEQKDPRFDTQELTSSTIVLLIIGMASFLATPILYYANNQGYYLTIALSFLAPYAICRILIRIWKQLRILKSYKEWEAYNANNKENA